MPGLKLGLGLGLGANSSPVQGVPQPPPGFVFLLAPDGAYLTGQDGVYLMEPA